MRFFQISTGVERMYGCSDGSIAAIFSISSVASSSMTSMASSKVTMPTRRFSVSTTGRARKLYLLEHLRDLLLIVERADGNDVLLHDGLNGRVVVFTQKQILDRL